MILMAKYVTKHEGDSSSCSEKKRKIRGGGKKWASTVCVDHKTIKIHTIPTVRVRRPSKDKNEERRR